EGVRRRLVGREAQRERVGVPVAVERIVAVPGARVVQARGGGHGVRDGGRLPLDRRAGGNHQRGGRELRAHGLDGHGGGGGLDGRDAVDAGRVRDVERAVGPEEGVGGEREAREEVVHLGGVAVGVQRDA